MYETFFGFNDRPFSPAPQAKRFFSSSAAESARQTLSRCLDRGEGIGLLIGPAGTGKTLLCQLLAEEFHSRFAVALLSSGRICTRRNFYQAVLFELGLPYRGMDEGELPLALVDHLLNSDSINGGLLLMIDEAHTLPLRMVDEARLLTNLTRNGRSRVRLVISGGPRLEERLASPKLESFNQRVSARCYLQAFSYDETLTYVRVQVSGVGGTADRVFAHDSFAAVHRATDGIPRLINQVCDRALIVAFDSGVRQITPAVIEEAWADLQQLPTPWNAAPGASEPTPDIIEFGALDDVELAPSKKSAEKAIVAKLHALPANEDTRQFDGELDTRLDVIEATLKAIDGDDDRAAQFAKQIETPRPVALDPFAETFADEEEVVDRLARLEANVLANRPLVRSAEGRELSALLKRHETKVGSSLSDDTRGAEDNPPEVNDVRPADDPVLPEESSTVSILIGAAIDETFDGDRSIRSTNPRGHFDNIGLAEQFQDSDRDPAIHNDEEDPGLDLIVVEDDPPDPNSPSPPSGPRREGFQQLFTRLRGG
jgi:type II secretory pathway predicted ATPase ExeA